MWYKSKVNVFVNGAAIMNIEQWYYHQSHMSSYTTTTPNQVFTVFISSEDEREIYKICEIYAQFTHARKFAHPLKAHVLCVVRWAM